MKKTLIAGAASLAFAATPVFGVFATNPAALTDTLTVTVAVSCTFSRTTGEGTYAKTMTANELDPSFGTSTFTSHCNNGTGYTITPTFTSLTFSGAAQPIAYSTTTPTAGSGTWTAQIEGGANIAATNGVLMNTNQQDPVGGTTATVIYKVSLNDDQAQGTYRGTATYTLAQKS